MIASYAVLTAWICAPNAHLDVWRGAGSNYDNRMRRNPTRRTHLKCQLFKDGNRGPFRRYLFDVDYAPVVALSVDLATFDAAPGHEHREGERMISRHLESRPRPRGS